MLPVIFRIGGFEVRAYGLMVLAGIAAGVLVSGREASRKGLGSSLMAEFAPGAVIFGLLGARLFFIMTHPGFFLQNPLQTLNFRAGGLGFYGGLSAGILYALYFTRRRGIPFPVFADCGAPGISAGLIFGRIGCLLNGCCYGVPSRAPWAVVFTRDSSSAPLGVPLHPVQVYEAAGSLVILAFLWSFRGKFRSGGSMFALFLSMYSALRLGLEYFRGDTLTAGDSNIVWTQPVLLVIILAGLSYYSLKFFLERRSGIED